MKKLFKNPFIQGGIWLTMANFIVGGLNYLFNLFAARLLGPEGYGTITTLFSYLAILTIPLGAISNVLVQKIGAVKQAYPYARAIELWSYEKIRKWWLILLVPLLLTPWMPTLTNLDPIAAYSIIPLVMISALATLYDGILTGLHIFFWSSIMGIIIVALKLAGVGVGYLTPYPLFWIVILFDISLIIKIILSKWLLISTGTKEKDAVIPIIEKRVISVLTDKQMILTVVSLISITIIQNLNMIYAKKMFSPEDAGLFAAWSLLAKIISYLIGPLIGISYVFFSNKKDEIYHRMYLIVGLFLLVVMGIIANIAYGYFDKLIVQILFGQKFFALRPFVEWAALFGSGYLIVSFVNTYFMAKGSKATYILPATIPLYIIMMFVYVENIGDLVFLDTFFIFFVLILFLLPLLKDRFVRLFK